MALVITVDDLVIDQWDVDLDRQYVNVHYRLMVADETYKTKHAIFWVTLPVDHYVEGRDFQLPAAYAAMLNDLTNDANSVLTAYWNI